MNGAYGMAGPIGDSKPRSVVEQLTSEQRCGRYTGLSWRAEGSVVTATGTPDTRQQFEQWCSDLGVTTASITFRPECATARGHRGGVQILLTAHTPWKWWNT